VKRILQFIKNWTLPISMAIGIALYLIYYFTPALKPIGQPVYSFLKFLQPVLIFFMLFLQFNRVSPHDLKIQPWHVIVATIQCVFMIGLALFAIFIPDGPTRIVVESAMLCFICPTATAAGVITSKLGGSISSVMTYVVLINCLVSLIFPALLPFLEPDSPYTFMQSFWMVIRKVFSILILPCLTAWVIRYTLRKVQIFFMRYVELAFYLWSVSLTIALTITTRQLIISRISIWVALMICAVTFASCLLQFWIGRKVGNKYSHCDAVTAGQAMGQKNTVFSIWLGYTFLSPATSVSGGFYSLIHNAVNSWELYQQRKADSKKN